MVTSGTPDPGPAGTGPRIGHYLVGGDTALVARVAEQLGGEAGVTVRIVSGSVERPTVLGVAMTQERADRLRTEFQGRLVVEVDQDIESYSDK
ncbi:hypothetical protein ABZT04_32415 [Streptomyces sp. NPDC005492]|uniref:hypothetical protein n=1 Tax=Streptomyces sp. NPDC005492 TaxID=3156883 RepID=UPI0033BF9FAA